jgi:hypothetical protein
MRIHNIRKNEADWHTKKICEFCESIIKICGFAIYGLAHLRSLRIFNLRTTYIVACDPAAIACIPAVADIPAKSDLSVDHVISAVPGFSS